MTHRLEITISDDTLARLDDARGHEPRASFVKRALESALGSSSGHESASAPMRRDPVSSRAPVEKEPPLPRRADTLPGNMLPAPLAFKCPVSPCTFTAKSPAAKCGMHGRTVVPV